jgi:hypothetical protein
MTYLSDEYWRRHCIVPAMLLASPGWVVRPEVWATKAPFLSCLIDNQTICDDPEHSRTPSVSQIYLG